LIHGEGILPREMQIHCGEMTQPIKKWDGGMVDVEIARAKAVR